MKLIAFLLLISISTLAMENPEAFSHPKYIILAAANPSPQAHIQIIARDANPPKTMQNNCYKYISNELKLLLPAMAVTACGLYATTNLSCSQGLSIGCGCYLLNVLCLSDENESLSRETYSGQAALYLKRRAKDTASTLFPCLITKISARKDE